MLASRQVIEGDAWTVELGGTTVRFGPGVTDRLGEHARRLGCQRVLLVTDRGLAEAGHLDRAAAALARESVGCVVHDGVRENPTTRDVEEGVAVAREAGVDGIVALGGGSAMDCAKGINFLLTQGGRMEDYWGSGKARHPMLPSIGLPTTAGTGSEAQSYALIGQEETGRKMACGDPKARFRAVLLDPRLAGTAPRRVVAASGLDAATHVIESYVCTRRNPVAQALASEAWRQLDRGFEIVLGDPSDERAWGRTLVGAHLAGAAIEHAMLGAAHSCANPLTERFHVTHGLAVAMVLPHVMRFNAPRVGRLYEELHAVADGGEPSLESRFLRLRSATGLPARLRDYGVPGDSLSELARAARQQWTAAFNPRPVDIDDLVGIYEAAY